MVAISSSGIAVPSSMTRFLRNGNVPHPARDGHIRTTGFPVIGDKVFDGYFRAVRQPGGKIGETAVQFCGLLRGEFAPFGGQPGSFPYRRLVARQRGKRRELCGSVVLRHLRMVPRDVMRQADDVIVGCFQLFLIPFIRCDQMYLPVTLSRLERISAGVPTATMRPPSLPPPGPMSTIQSAERITSRSCSITTTVAPLPMR